MYSRIINGEETFFGVSGKLIRNVLVMYDKETSSLWSQLYGESVAGPLLGTKLEYLPSVMTTWANWRESHPDTLAIQKGFFGNRDPYLNYYYSDSAGVIGSTNFDDRLQTKEFVIGVEVGPEAMAYPFSVLNGEPVVNDTVGGKQIVVIFDKATATGVVWDREIPDGQELEFTYEEGLRMRDTLTNTLWDGLSGMALQGELEGTVLERVKSTQSFWFGWVDLYEDTLLYGIEEN